MILLFFTILGLSFLIHLKYQAIISLATTNKIDAGFQFLSLFSE